MFRKAVLAGVAAVFALGMGSAQAGTTSPRDRTTLAVVVGTGVGLGMTAGFSPSTMGIGNGTARGTA